MSITDRPDRSAVYACTSTVLEEVVVGRDNVNSIVDTPEKTTYTLAIDVDIQGLLDTHGNTQEFLDELHDTICAHQNVTIKTKSGKLARSERGRTFVDVMTTIIESLFNESKELNMREVQRTNVSVKHEVVQEELNRSGGIFAGKLVSADQYQNVQEMFTASLSAPGYIEGDSFITRLRLVDGDSRHGCKRQTVVAYRLRFEIYQSARS